MSFGLKFCVCRHLSMWGFQNVSVRNTRNHPSFVNMSPTLVIDASLERSSRVLQHGNPKIRISFKKRSKLNFDLCWRAEIALVSPISVLTPAVVNDTSIERSSRVLYNEKLKVWRYSEKKNTWTECFCCHLLETIFSLYCAHWLCYHSIHKHSSWSQYISVLTTCTYLYDDIGDASSSFRGSASFI